MLLVRNYTKGSEGDVGDYFAKQNAHLGATPPQWRAGSSLPMRKKQKSGNYTCRAQSQI